MDTEVISYNLDATAGYEFFRVLDRSRDALGRDTGFILGSTPAPGVGGGAPASTIVEAQAAYAYSPTDGRIAQISNPQISNQAFAYAYTPNSNLEATVTGPIHTVINDWGHTRDVLDTKQNKVGTTIISKYDYAVNAIGQRTGVTTTGTAFPALPSWLWSYDTLGQVIAADSSVNNSDRAYQYDAIGNRQKSADSLTLPSSDNYTSNALNQYTTLQPGGSGVSPVHDFDGNATAYPLPAAPTTLSTLIWDAENRLTEVKNAAGTTIEKNVFDSGSRKIATIANGVTTLYLYDAWNCIAEYAGTTLSKTRLWGMDLSGTRQGAGGVGGLLCESQISNSQISDYYPAYDGNGNISEYLTSTGTTAAHYEYDPFGNTVVNTDTSNQFAYRFSTKPRDVETGLYYYGYRYYDPLTGRWPSRDPIGERGGVNLYGFVGNDGVNWVDVLGLLAADEKCIVEIQIGHGREWDSFDETGYTQVVREWRAAGKTVDNIDHPEYVHAKKMHQCSRVGVMGCGNGTDQFNDYLTSNNHGIPGMPRTNGTQVGPSDTPEDVVNNNGDYPNGKKGWERMMIDAMSAAVKEANKICGSKEHCCEEVTVRIKCSAAAQKMNEANNLANYCGKSIKIPCGTIK